MAAAGAPAVGHISTWSAEDTTPEAIDGALRRLLAAHHAQDRGSVPARVLNLVLVIDAPHREEIEARLAGVGRYHPSRTILCVVDADRTTLSAHATLGGSAAAASTLAVTTERVVVHVGPEQLADLDTVVDWLVVSDLPTVLWVPDGHPEAIAALCPLVQTMLLDSVDEPEPRDGLARALALTDATYVVDLAWLRSTPWRERIAAVFDPPELRPALDRIARVTVRHHPDSVAAGVLLLAWLATRLGWDPGTLAREGDELHGVARNGAPIELRLTPDREQDVRGLAGMRVQTSDGLAFSLDRGPGGLRAQRRVPGGTARSWTLMGASRGEAGILGEGIRQTLLRDPTYKPALAAANAMLMAA